MDKNLEASCASTHKLGGPKTARGKARASKNALRHGLLAASPAILGLERHSEWEAHLDGVFKWVQPVGYFEKLFAHRCALILWKLWRIARYEKEIAEAAITNAEFHLWVVETAESLDSRRPLDPIAARRQAENAVLAIELLKEVGYISETEILDPGAIGVIVGTLRWKVATEGKKNRIREAEFQRLVSWVASKAFRIRSCRTAHSGRGPDTALHGKSLRDSRRVQ